MLKVGRPSKKLKEVILDKDNNTKMTITIPKDVKRKLRDLSLDQEISLTDIAMEAIYKYLKTL